MEISMKQSIAHDFKFLSLMRFALPSMIMMVFMSLYTIVDGIFISRLVGSVALSANNIVYPAVNILMAIGIMLATGGSSLAAIEYLRECGVKNLKLMVLVAAPEGIRSVLDADPDVTVYTCAIDDGLNDDAYIVPGLGDAGDRIFGTK